MEQLGRGCWYPENLMRFIIVKLLSMVLSEVRVKLRVRRVKRQRAEGGLNVLLPFMLLSHR
jgi:hypothetical protein